MADPKFAKSSDAKASGWFSRRNETAEAHQQNPRRNRKAQRQHNAEVARTLRAALGDRLQLVRLDKLLGDGVGAKRERARLARKKAA